MRDYSPLDGKQFGRLKVEYRSLWQPNSRNSSWICLCQCGQRIIATAANLKSGEIVSCGCVRHDTNVTHGHARRGDLRSSEYRTWAKAKDRCVNSHNKNYARYGGRGISMCQLWQDSFEAFISHIGLCPKGLTLERIQNDGNYEPGNVKWADRSAQAKNRRMRPRDNRGLYLSSEAEKRLIA